MLLPAEPCRLACPPARPPARARATRHGHGASAKQLLLPAPLCRPPPAPHAHRPTSADLQPASPCRRTQPGVVPAASASRERLQRPRPPPPATHTRCPGSARLCSPGPAGRLGAPFPAPRLEKSVWSRLEPPAPSLPSPLGSDPRSLPQLRARHPQARRSRSRRRRAGPGAPPRGLPRAPAIAREGSTAGGREGGGGGKREEEGGLHIREARGKSPSSLLGRASQAAASPQAGNGD